MATWVVGDVQGCKKALKRLLKKVDFSWKNDRLWSAGDIVNRGPSCLKTLRYFYKHRDRITLVLGNHDLHLLAVAAGVRKLHRSDTLGPILEAEDAPILLNWLRQQPLMHREHGFTMVHAGIAPQWSLDEAASYAEEVQTALRGPSAIDFFKQMYGNEPARFDEQLRGQDRLRTITNYFTRMRYCTQSGVLDLQSKGPPDTPGGPAADNPDLQPWFAHENRKAAGKTILFGHWASLNGITHRQDAIALDTGCVWGNCMTAYCLETGELVHKSCE